MDKENDLFSAIVKDKLVNYTLPVDDDSWDRIAERLYPVTRRKIGRKWIAAIAVAASIALLFLLLLTDKKDYRHETANLLSNHEETVIQNVFEEETVQPVLPQDVRPSALFRDSSSEKRLAANELATEVILEEKAAEENPAILAHEELSVSENRPVSPVFYPNYGDGREAPVIKRKKQQSIRFSLGTGGSLLADNSTSALRSSTQPSDMNPNIMYYKAVAQEHNRSQAEEILSYENYPDVTTRPPLSFGITIKKELNRTFALESGILYTFLSTAFNREAFPKGDADLQLHYIGIPLNIHARLFGDRFSCWEVYLSAGGMVEKGILSNFVQRTYYDNSSVNSISSSEKIDGLQWSVGLSPGVDYQLYKSYSIYIEPKLGYYFDNNQPLSARTKHPVVFGINAGIRYSW